MLTEADDHLIQYWMDVFRDVADAADPQRCRFKAPDGAARMEKAGRPIFEQLAARLAPGQLRFEPVPWPRLSRYDVSAVKLMAEAGNDPLWGTSGGFDHNIDARFFGISWALALDLNVWRLDFDEALDWYNPSAKPRWSVAEAAAHEAEGRVLAERLAGELAATGRAHVPVSFWSESAQAWILVQPG